jgi:hypothetical protein
MHLPTRSPPGHRLTGLVRAIGATLRSYAAASLGKSDPNVSATMWLRTILAPIIGVRLARAPNLPPRLGEHAGEVGMIAATDLRPVESERSEQFLAPSP